MEKKVDETSNDNAKLDEVGETSGPDESPPSVALPNTAMDVAAPSNAATKTSTEAPSSHAKEEVVPSSSSERERPRQMMPPRRMRPGFEEFEATLPNPTDQEEEGQQGEEPKKKKRRRKKSGEKSPGAKKSRKSKKEDQQGGEPPATDEKLPPVVAKPPESARRKRQRERDERRQRGPSPLPQRRQMQDKDGAYEFTIGNAEDEPTDNDDEEPESRVSPATKKEYVPSMRTNYQRGIIGEKWPAPHARSVQYIPLEKAPERDLPPLPKSEGMEVEWNASCNDKKWPWGPHCRGRKDSVKVDIFHPYTHEAEHAMKVQNFKELLKQPDGWKPRDDFRFMPHFANGCTPQKAKKRWIVWNSLSHLRPFLTPHGFTRGVPRLEGANGCCTYHPTKDGYFEIPQRYVYAFGKLAQMYEKAIKSNPDVPQTPENKQWETIIQCFETGMENVCPDFTKEQDSDEWRKDHEDKMQAQKEVLRNFKAYNSQCAENLEKWFPIPKKPDEDSKEERRFIRESLIDYWRVGFIVRFYALYICKELEGQLKKLKQEKEPGWEEEYMYLEMQYRLAASQCNPQMYFDRIPWTSRGYERYSKSLESLAELEGPTFAVTEGVHPGKPWRQLEDQDSESGGKSFHKSYRATQMEWMHSKYNIVQAKGDQSDETPQEMSDQYRRATFRFMDVECVAGFTAPLLVKYLLMARKNNQLWTQWWHSADPLSCIYPKMPRKDYLSPEDSDTMSADRRTTKCLRAHYYGVDSNGKDKSDAFTLNGLLYAGKQQNCTLLLGSQETVDKYHAKDDGIADWPSLEHWSDIDRVTQGTPRARQW